MQSTTTKVNQYISVAVQMAEAAGTIIRNVHASGKLGKMDKGIDDPVTIADLTAQKTIEEVYKSFFPTLFVQGEETEENMAGLASAVDPSTVNPNFIKEEQLLANQEKRSAYLDLFSRKNDFKIQDNFTEFPTEKAIAWVDPLDGTKEFLRNNLSAVTVLIGLSIDGVSKIGVVHYPFNIGENDGKGLTLFATQEHGAYKLIFDQKMTPEELDQRIPEYMEPFDIERVYDETYQISGAIGRTNPAVEKFFKECHPITAQKVAAGGNKTARIALGQVDTYATPGYKIKLWDLCAPEAIVTAMGGYCAINDTGKQIDYTNLADPCVPEFTIAQTKNLHNEIVKRQIIASKVDKEGEQMKVEQNTEVETAIKTN